MFSGDVVQGADVDVVRENLQRELNISDAKIAQIMSGRTVVLKSNMSHAAAELFQGRLHNLGAVCRIKNLSPVDKSMFRIDKANKDRVDYTLRDITAAHVMCPRCGHMQLETQFCARCGVDMPALLKQQRKEDQIIARKIRELREGNALKTAMASPGAEKSPAKKKTPQSETDPFKEPIETENRRGKNPFRKGPFPWSKR